MRSFSRSLVVAVLSALAPALFACSKSPPKDPTPAAAQSSASSAESDPLVGKPAPDFTAKAHDGEEIHLAALKGKTVVLYFYPKDETPGCTKEACSFRDAWKAIGESGAVLVGVSTDDLESHKRFAEHFKLPFHLVTDANGEIAASYGVGKTMGYLARQTFVIDKSGIVRRVYRSVDVAVHASQVTADLKALPR